MKQTLIQKYLDPKQRLQIHGQPKKDKRRYQLHLQLKEARFLQRRGKKARRKGRSVRAGMEKNITPLFGGRNRLGWRRSQWGFRTIWGLGIILSRIETRIAQARPGRLRRHWSRKHLDAIGHIQRRVALLSATTDLWDAETRRRKEPFLMQLESLQKKIS